MPHNNMTKIQFELKPHTTYDKIEAVINEYINDKQHLKANNKGTKFYNIPCAFDIETTSFYRDAQGHQYDYQQSQSTEAPLEKCSTMYVWQLGINGKTLIGRTWEQFEYVCDVLYRTLNLSSKKKLIIYVHNLSYEFQFIRRHFVWEKVFSVDNRKPVYAITSTGIEFRCSYLLSGYSLAKLGEQLTKYKCRKLTGDLDYSLLRHSETELTTEELMYCVNDVKVVMCYIQELIEQYGNITKLPLTNTGFVRRYCRKQCFYKLDPETGKKVNNYKYTDMIQGLRINGVEEFNMLQRAFAGGFTHANADKVDTVHENVSSYDFTSSYPYVMVSEKYPMSTGIQVDIKSLQQLDVICDKYCAIFDIELTNVFPRITTENPISASKCYIKENAVENNGRIVAASKLLMTITNVDYRVLQDFYTWGGIKIGRCYVYKKAYLPTEFVHSILDLYAKKTTLKGVQGKEVEYMNSKGMLNSCYGMCVTNPLRDEYTYDNENSWGEKSMTVEEQAEALERYNNSRNRFLFYVWGIFVTAYARANLFTGIKAVGEDYIYSDTDSIKFTNRENHLQYFKEYNDTVLYKLRTACKYHGISVDMVEPKTIKGVNKLLGVWDYEGDYLRFKTLGAKRYMVQEANGAINITVSGVNKHSAVPYLNKLYNNDTERIFNAFSNYLDIPPQATGKNIHSYIDYPITGTLVDYTGKPHHYYDETGVHLEPTGYTLSISKMFINYLLGIRFKKA